MLRVGNGTICFEMLPNNRKTVFKIDSMGNVLWNRYYEFQDLVSFNEAILINDSEIVVTAHHKQDGIPTIPHSCNPFLIKFDTNGSIKNIKAFRYNSYCTYENLFLYNNSIYASGSMDSNWTYYGTLAKFNLNMEPIWQYKSDINSDYYADIVSILNNGNFFMGSLKGFSSIDTNGIGLCNFTTLTDSTESISYHEFIDDDITATDIYPLYSDTLLNIFNLPIDTTTLCINSNIEDKQITNSNNYLIYPNPTKGKLTITTKNIISVELLNMQGKSIFCSKQVNKQDIVNVTLENYINGIYIVKITTISGVFVDKLILKKE